MNGIIEKIKAYLLVYVVMGVLSLFVTICAYFGDIPSVISSILFLGLLLCYAFPEFKRKIRFAVVRIIILDLLFLLLFFAYYCMCCVVIVISAIHTKSVVLIIILWIVVSFLFFWIYKFLFYRWFAGEKIKFKKVIKDFCGTIVLLFLFFVLAMILFFIEDMDDVGVNYKLIKFLEVAFVLLLLYSLIITDIVRGYFVRKRGVLSLVKQKLTYKSFVIK